MSIPIFHNDEPMSLSSRSKLRVHGCLLLITMMFLGIHPMLGSLGETEEQCNRRYGGITKVLSFDTGTKTKEVLYGRMFDNNVRVTLVDDKAVAVQHLGGGLSMSDSTIASCLDDNAQGHQWTLTKTEGDKRRNWRRDDGASAELEPILSDGNSGDHWIRLAIWPPHRATPASSPEHSLMHELGTALVIMFAFGFAVYGFSRFVPFVIDKLIVYFPKKPER